MLIAGFSGSLRLIDAAVPVPSGMGTDVGTRACKVLSQVCSIGCLSLRAAASPLRLLKILSLVDLANDDFILIIGPSSVVALSPPLILDATPVTVPVVAARRGVRRLLSAVVLQD